MSDQSDPPRSRPRGYSLRTQLFFKSAATSNTNDLEKGAQDNSTTPASIELEPIPSNPGQLELSETDSLEVSVRDASRIRHASNNQYTGRRGKMQEKLVDLKNLLTNNKPEKASKDGRKIPISVCRDFDRDQFPTHLLPFETLVDERYNKPYVNNAISSSRYSLYSFLPKQLIFQFSKIANLYFLTVSILQMIPSWSTTGTYTTIIPLLVFVTISILREGYDDYRRNLQDKKENNKFTKIVTSADHAIGEEADVDLYSVSRAVSQTSAAQLNPAQFNDTSSEDDISSDKNSFTNVNKLKQLGVTVSKIKWKDIKVGDIIKLGQDEPVPADIVLLTSDGQNENEVFIETMDLDGETNLKSKIPHSKITSVMNNAKGLKEFKGSISIEDPNTDLYNFEGNVIIEGHAYPLGPDNVVYRGSITRNTKNVMGLVIFTGEETKIRMNAIKNPRTKAPKLQKAINLIVMFMVFVVLSLAMFSFMAQRLILNKYRTTAWYLYGQEAGVAPTIMSFIIMYNTLIPLSLYVTTEIIKVVQMLFLQWDIDMYHKPSNTPCEARTATILEELGQVSYVFSDKTGTLTDNLMIFRKLSVNGTAWSHEVDDLELSSSGDQISQYPVSISSPRASIDIRKSNTVYTGRPSLASALSAKTSKPTSLSRTSSSPNAGKNPEIKTTLELLKHLQLHPNTLFSKKAKFFILSLALCHTCLPKTLSDDDDHDDEIEYQSSSPDELALVVAARDMGYVVYGKTQRELIIRTYPHGMDQDPVDEKYEVLNVVEFSSRRKRMTVIVKFPDGRICLLCKGADSIILDRLKDVDLTARKRQENSDSSSLRRAQEAQVVLNQRQSMDINNSGTGTSISRRSFQFSRPSMGSIHSGVHTIDDVISNHRREEEVLDDVISESRKSLHLQQKMKYNIASVEEYIGNDKLVLNEEYVIEKTLQHIDEFSTDGLRTLLYGFRWLDQLEYDKWAAQYANAKASLKDRAKLTEKVGSLLENNLELLGATAIEDKLQDGVSESIEKLRRAGIKLWMLTGDKRETAINIGYSCKLIKDYSTVVVLDSQDGDITAKMTAAELELDQGSVAHCVVVIDGATLAEFEADTSLLSIFISLCTKTDSVICCRASPSQKAMMVTSVRNLKKNQVTLAIGDGANDIAMIQSADIGIGITGKEGLQAARSSDYSIAQFRYLQKLLLVHGRYNYIRTSKFVLSTFYKELLFYLSQAIFQRNAMFTGTSLYEPWSLSMFNTLFTSLPVLCIGMFEKDLKPATLLAVPELYSKGRLSKAFNLPIFLGWMIVATGTSLLICFTSWYLWGFSATYDNSLYPMGVLTFTAIVFTINIKLQFIEQHDRTYLNWLSALISCLGWLLWCCLLPGLYKPETSKIYDVYRGIYWKFGRDVTWWAALLIIVAMPILLDFIIQILRCWMMPSDVDEFQTLEKNTEIRREIENEAYEQMQQGWNWTKDEPTLKRLVTRKRHNTVTLDTELPPGSPSTVEKNSSTRLIQNDSEYEKEVLPSGKVIKRRVNDSSHAHKIGKKLRFSTRNQSLEQDEDIDDIIQKRMKDLE